MLDRLQVTLRRVVRTARGLTAEQWRRVALVTQLVTLLATSVATVVLLGLLWLVPVAVGAPVYVAATVLDSEIRR